mgnify:CR=1 FL=1
MKRSLFTNSFKKTLLTVPAAALMLGAAQAGTTVGLNITSYYYDSGTTPQTVGFGQGYQTTGFPVTAKAFGVEPANWVNTDAFYTSVPVLASVAMGSVTADLSAVNPWESDIGNLVNPDDEWGQGGPLPVSWSSVLPGNDELTWSFEDNTGWTNTLSGLNTGFPNGYVIELIGASKCTASSQVVFTDGTTSFTNVFDPIYTAGNANFSGPVGLSVTPALNSDTITFGSVSRNVSSAQSCALAGFIITDQPVVTRDPSDASVNQGDTLILTANSIGLTNALYYQWQHAGTNILGANDATYTKAGVTADDAGDYNLVVTNLYGAATSGTASVNVIALPSITKDLTETTSTVYSGANFSGWSITAAGGLPLQYNWLKNGATPVGANSPVLMLTNVSTADSGDYAVTVVNSFGSAQSATNHLIVVPSPNLYITDVVQDSPNAFWPLNESSGTIANDYSGNGKNGTITNGVTLGVDGPRPPAYQGFNAASTAYQFDGGSGYIDCGTAPSLSGTTDFTLEAWINTTATANGVIIQQRSATGYNGEYQFQVTAAGNLNFMIYGGGSQYSFTTTRTVNDGQWHYVAAERSGANGYIYIDGTLAASANGTPAPLDPTIQTYIGNDQRDSVSYFSGSISDLAIYGRALSVHDITLHAYNGLKGNAPFAISVVPGGYIADSKPAGDPHYGLNNNVGWTNSVTDFNFPAVTRDGVAVFSGGSQIAIPANADFDSPNGTIVFWLQANAPIPGPGSEGAILFDRRTTVGTVIVLYDDGSIFWQGQNGSQNTFEAGYVPDNNWHLIAVTYGQAVNDTLSVYVDGQLYGSTIVTNGWSWPTGQEIEIGRSHDSYWKALNGQMDDFRIYNRVLTDTEIGQIYTSGALVDSAALKVRYNFDTAGAGQSLSWPAGVLESSPSLGASAVWTTVSNAIPPYPFMPPAPATPTNPALFYRAGF